VLGEATSFTPGGAATVEPDASILLPGGGVDSSAIDAWPTAQAGIGGVWMWRPSLRVDTLTVTTLPICTLEVFNTTNGTIAPGAPPPNANGLLATREIMVDELRTAFPPGSETAPSMDVYWNGIDTLELRIIRTAAHEPGPQLWFDGGWLRSAFSAPEHEGLAPVDDRVECFVPIERPMSITVSVYAEIGWQPEEVDASLREALREYFRQIAYSTGTYMDSGGRVTNITLSNDVIYGAVGAAIQMCDGVQRYDPATLTVNGGVVDIEIWKGDVAVLSDPTTYITVIMPAALSGWQRIGPPNAELDV
jgi:hypothetical protein